MSPRFTDRECRVIGLLAQGLPNAEMALRLSVTESTVKGILKSCFDKSGMHSRLQLVVWCWHHNIVELPKRLQ
jgi:DNA-binding NarL/FixJ family response regulator